MVFGLSTGKLSSNCCILCRAFCTISTNAFSICQVFRLLLSLRSHLMFHSFLAGCYNTVCLCAFSFSFFFLFYLCVLFQCFCTLSSLASFCGVLEQTVVDCIHTSFCFFVVCIFHSCVNFLPDSGRSCFGGKCVVGFKRTQLALTNPAFMYCW